MRFSKKCLLSLVFPVFIGIHGEAYAQTSPVTIQASGNPCCGGNGLNYYKNISNGKLLPIFEGGYLWLSNQPNPYSQNFSVDDSLSNILDTNQNLSSLGDAHVSSIFSDYLGKKGSIKFKPIGRDLYLSNQSNITGTVQFGTGPNLSKIFLSGIGSFEDASLVRVDGQLDLTQNSKLSGVTFKALESTSISKINIANKTLTVGSGNTNTVSSGEILGANGRLVKDGSGSLTLQGKNTYTGNTLILDGTLVINGSTTSETEVLQPGTLAGTGTITGNVVNEGRVSPGSSIGTLTINGNYKQTATGILELEVGAAGKSDLLQINNGKVIDLAGQVLIKPDGSALPTPGAVYTGISTNPGFSYTGPSTAKADSSSVILGTGFHFVRGQDPDFNLLTGSPTYDPTKLQFGWVQNAVNPGSGTTSGGGTGSGGSVLLTNTPPGKSTINSVKKTGGAITSTITQTTSQSQTQCTANTGNRAACQAAVNSSGNSGASATSANNINKAKVIDAGMTSVFSAANADITGGSSIGTTGYTTNQAKAALVTPDFVNVYSAFLQLPTVAQVNQALHSITAEPYASMQSVALESMEQFGKNSLALTDRSVPLTHTQTFCKTDDGTLIPADSPERPDTCDEREKTVGSRWSLLLDGSNTEASLDGTNDLASLDYNIVSTIYGLQYAFSPEWSTGAAFSYGQANLYDYEYANANINADTYGGSLWGIYRPSADWKFSGLLGYMNLQYDSNRKIRFGGLNRTAEANWDSDGFTTALEAQYNWALNGQSSDPDGIRLKPRTFISYSVHNQGSFTESGAKSLNLAIDSHTADAFLWGLGLTLETPIRISSSSRIIPRFTVGYEHDFMGSADEEHQLSSSFSELPALGSIDVLGQNRGADALDLGLSIEIETADSVSLYGAINGGFWSNGTEISYGGGIKYSW